MKVAVLGFGPSGHMAAWAAVQCGHQVEFFSDSFTQHKNYGVFFLHDPCDLPLVGQTVYQKVIGHKDLEPEKAAAQYGKFVYGNEAEGWGIIHALNEPKITGFDPNQAMELLSVYLADVKRTVAKFENFGDILSLKQDFEKIICTIPADVVFKDENFPFKYAYVISDAKNGRFEQNFFIDNVNPFLGWYRLSHVFGRYSAEYPYEVHSEAKRVKKVIGGKEFTERDGIYFTGRFGAWNRKIRTEHVYSLVLNYLTGGKYGIKPFDR